MGLSSSKQTTKTNSTNNESATTTPILPSWTMPAFDDYSSRIAQFGNMDPNSFVAGSSPLQQMAWNNVGSLDDWQGQARLASERAASIAGRAAATCRKATSSPRATLPRRPRNTGEKPTSTPVNSTIVARSRESRSIACTKRAAIFET